MFFLKKAVNRPADIYSLALKTTTMEQLTAVNSELLSKLEMNPAEEFWFDGAAGEKVQGFLVKPPFFDPSKKYPLVMLIHGGPQNAWSDNFHFRWNAQMFASPGYVVAMVNFHGSTGFGQLFTDSISGDWGGKPFEDIMLGLDYLLSRYDFIDKSRLAAAGASYGGYMIDWIEGHTDRFKCLISHSGVFDLRSMYGASDELWFPEWDFRGTPWSNKESYEKWSPSSYVKILRLLVWLSMDRMTSEFLSPRDFSSSRLCKGREFRQGCSIFPMKTILSRSRKTQSFGGEPCLTGWIDI